jgi:transposase
MAHRCAAACTAGLRAARRAKSTRYEMRMLNDLNPIIYLHYVFERIAERPINRIEDLLPWIVAAELAAEKQKVAA